MPYLLGRPAGFWRRALALVLDQIILAIGGYFLSIAVLYILYLAMPTTRTFTEVFPPAEQFSLSMYAILFLDIPYEIAFHYFKGWTPGKRVLSVVVVDYKTKGSLRLKQCVIRFIAKSVASIPFGAGLVTAAWDKEKRGVQDMLAGTISYKFQKNPLVDERSTSLNDAP